MFCTQIASENQISVSATTTATTATSSTTTMSISTSTTTQTDSPSTESSNGSSGVGRVLSSTEEVGIHWNSNFEMCPSSVDMKRIDDTKTIDDNQSYQQAQASNGNNVINSNQLHSNDDNSSECNSFNVSSSDGNKPMLPHNMIASASISSCSDEAAEQLLTVAPKNQRLNDRLPTSMDTNDRVQMTKDSSDCTVESTSLSFEPTSTDCLSQPSQSPESSTATVYRRIQPVNDKSSAVNFDMKADDLIQNDDEFITPGSLNDPSDDYNQNQTKSLRSQAKKSITAVHPTTRHNQLPNAICKTESIADTPKDMANATPSSSSTSSAPQKHFECSIPLSSIKTNSLFSKSVETRNSSQINERTIRSTQNVINAELTDNVQATANTSSFARRRVVDRLEMINDNENIPSTIMERKNYIKKPNNNKTTSTDQNQSNRPQQIQTNRPQQTRSPTLTIEPRHSQQQQQHRHHNHQHQSTSQHSTNEHQHISQTAQTKHQSYIVYQSGTELDLGLNDIGSPLSECASSNPLQSLTSAFCESDNNLIHNTNVTMKLNGPTALLPSAIVHPLGLEQHASRHSTKINAKQIPEKASFNETTSSGMHKLEPEVALISSDERSSVENNIDSGGKLHKSRNIYKRLCDRLQIEVKSDPEKEMRPSSLIKDLLKTANRLIDSEETNAMNYSPEPTDENGEGNASLPLKKRRIMSVFNDTIIKEEESDSQPSFESPSSMPSVQCDIELGSASLPSPPPPHLPSLVMPAVTATATPATVGTCGTSVGTSMNLNDDNPPIAHMECVSYPPTPMLSIANIVEYLPVRAYSTFKTPAPEIAPVRFNILPQQTMVINNASTPNVMGNPNTSGAGASTTTSGRGPSNQHVEFETTFNLIQSQQNLTANQANQLNTTAPPNVVSNGNINCGLVAADGELMANIGPIPTDVAQYHQTFHSNSPYAYSIQPTHTNPNSLPPNFEIQNMFNLRNYQMNPQHYHNLLQNSLINFQEKKSILLNDFGNSMNDGVGQDTIQSNQSHHHDFHHFNHNQQHQQQQHQSQTQHHQNVMPTPIDIDTKTSINKTTIAPRTKAARKMVAESVTVPAIPSSNDKISTSKTNRVTRSSIRTTRAQNINTEQKSPRRKTNRHR